MERSHLYMKPYVEAARAAILRDRHHAHVDWASEVNEDLKNKRE